MTCVDMYMYTTFNSTLDILILLVLILYKLPPVNNVTQNSIRLMPDISIYMKSSTSEITENHRTVIGTK